MAELGGSALFAARFRENAARALLLPRRRPGQRTPLWMQRQKSADLLAVASRYGSFPIILETYREVLRDVFDMPALRRAAGRHPRAAHPRRQRRVALRVAVRQLAPVRLRRLVHVRGRRAARRATRPGAGARPRAAGRAARHRGAARAARPGGGGRPRARAPGAGRVAPRSHRRRRRRPAAAARRPADR